MIRGLLLTLTELPPSMEEEFNAWDAPPGQGKYLAAYELDSLQVLFSPVYLQRFQNPTPWIQRCLGKAEVFRRWACEQVEPGVADPHPQARALLLNGETPKALQVRRFVAEGGERITLCERATSDAQPGTGIVYRLYQP